MSTREHRRAIVFILLATVFWSFPALAVKFLTRYSDLYAQNVVRFASASVLLWGVCLVRARREALSGLPMLLRVFPATIASFAYQYCYVRALYVPALLPGLAYLVAKLWVPFTAFLSFALFADERSLIRDWRFLTGVVLSLAGVIGLLPGNVGAEAWARTAGGTLGLGLLLIVASSVFWSLYTVFVKLLVRRGSPLVAFTYVCSLITLAFLLLAVLTGESRFHVPAGAEGVAVCVVAIGSGALCIGAAQVLYYYSIRTLGTVVCSTVLLSATFLAPLLSVLLFGERLGLRQAVAGLVLIAGCALTVQAQPGTTPDMTNGRSTNDKSMTESLDCG